MLLQSNMITSSDVFIEYKYVITEFYAIYGDKTDPIPIERISTFEIENHYHRASFPIFKINVLLEPSRYYNILKNKDSVRFKLRIQKFYVKNGTQEKSLYRDVINELFCLYIDDGNMDYEKELKRQAGTEDDINELSKVNNEVELYLFKEVVTPVRSVINTVLTSCNMSTALAYLLSKATLKKTLMSPIENTKVYPSVILPPQSIDKQFRYLNNTYGLHKKGTMIYFGLFSNYILNYTAGCTAYATNEWKDTVIIILESANVRALEGSYIRNGEQKNYINVSPHAITVKNSTVSENVIYGTQATVIDMQSNAVNTASSGAVVSGQENSTIIFNNSSNPYIADVYNAQRKGNSNIINMTLTNIDMENFKPNKAFTVVFESTSANTTNGGSYAISSAIYSFKKMGESYDINALLEFKKF